MDAKVLAVKLKDMNTKAKAAIKALDEEGWQETQRMQTTLQNELDEEMAGGSTLTKPFLTVDYSTAYQQYIIRVN